MKLRTYLLKGLLALACLVGMLGVAIAQTEQEVCWGTNWSAYDQVHVHWDATDCGSTFRSSLYVNGRQIGVVGTGTCQSGDLYFPGSAGISLGYNYEGCTGFCLPPYSGHFFYDCPVSFEDTGINVPPREGYFHFYVTNFPKLTLSVSKSASSPYLAVGASGQSYTIVINISNGPTTQAISVSDSLPTGFSTAGPVSATGGTLSGCPGVGSTTLAGCTIAAGTYGPVTITVPVNIAATAASHNNYTIYNTAYASGGGSTNCTGGGCSGSTSSAVINALDDTDTQPAGVPSNTDVSANDAFPAGSTFTATGGTCSNISPLTPASNTNGVLNYTLPGGSPSCTVNYQLCAPAPYNTVCDSATLTVSPLAGNPVIALNKALGGAGRAAANDQFTVQLLQNGTVVNNTSNSTTTGSGSTVTAGSGTTGSYSGTAGTTYTLNEVGSSGANLQRYNSSVVCSRNGVTQPVFNLGGSITPVNGDVFLCTITNSPRLTTLSLRQIVLSPVPVNLLPPFSQQYTGNNGWTQQTITNTALNTFNSGATVTLATNNVDTTIATTLPDARWFVTRFSCTDSNAAISGNSPGLLVSTTQPAVTLAAANVLPGANLVCTLYLGHLTP